MPKALKQKKDDILYSRPSEGLLIRTGDNCWIHIISNEQWEELLEKFKNNNLRVGSHIEYDIETNDIILIFVKEKYAKNTGFVAIVQTCSAMKHNDDNIKLYTDRNVNKYLAELETIIILERTINQAEFKDIINQYSNHYKSVAHFTSTVLKFNFTGIFTKMMTLDMGIKFVKYIMEHHDTAENDEQHNHPEQLNQPKQLNQLNQPDQSKCNEYHEQNEIKKYTSDNEIIDTNAEVCNIYGDDNEGDDNEGNGNEGDDDEDDDNEGDDNEGDDNEGDDNEGDEIKYSNNKLSNKMDNDAIIIDNTNILDTTTEYKSDENDNILKDVHDEYDDNIERIITNIPIMLIVCDQLRKVLKRLQLAKNRIHMVMNHYMYCKKCDITNNNRYELLMTYNRIDKGSIQFCQNNHRSALNAYLEGEPHPADTSREYIKIYYMQADTYYTNDILIEFSTKIFPIIEIMEQTKNK
jgi:hypothetical protein